MRKIENWVVTLVALVTMTGAFFADWNETHIFNDRWPPHAKYHNGQTMSLGVALGLCALFFLWRRRGDQALQFRVALIFAALYWITQLTAGLFPGTAWVDPEFAARIPKPLGIPGQVVIDSVLLGLLAVAYVMRIRWREQTPAPAVGLPPASDA